MMQGGIGMDVPRLRITYQKAAKKPKTTASQKIPEMNGIRLY